MKIFSIAVVVLAVAMMAEHFYKTRNNKTVANRRQLINITGVYG